MEIKAINFQEKFSRFSERFTPKIIARMNDYHFKLVRTQGDFIWHSHPDTDEVFVVIEGELRIDLRDGAVNLQAGEMVVIPRGVEHKPHADRECKTLLIEPAGTPNTGDAGGELTSTDLEWI